MKQKLWLQILIVVVSVELFSLVMWPSQFLTLRTQGFSFLFILFWAGNILITSRIKNERKKLLVNNIFLSLLYLFLLGASIYVISILSSTIDNPYANSMGIIILMVIVGILSLYILVYIWMKYIKHEKV